jgi:cytoskeletal protein RodZ
MKIPKIESLMVLAFFGVVAVWAISKCSAQKSNLERHSRFAEDDQEERPNKRDTLKPVSPTSTAPVSPTTTTPKSVVLPPPPPPSGNTAPPQSPGQMPVAGANPAQKPASSPGTEAKSASPNYTTLYVSIDGLKMRKSPGLKGELVTKLALYDPVYFLNKKSEKPEEISLGQEKVTDYWVKVRTKSGKEGWVFGAGVHFFKTKRKGVLE